MTEEELIDKIFVLFDPYYKGSDMVKSLQKLIADYTESVEERASDRRDKDGF
jgi:hypothetical protein